MTGLWQVLGADDIPFGEMVELDYRYVTTWSLFEDMRILLRTVPVVLRGAGGSCRMARSRLLERRTEPAALQRIGEHEVLASRAKRIRAYGDCSRLSQAATAEVVSNDWSTR